MRLSYLLLLALVAATPALPQTSSQLNPNERQFIDKAAQINMTEAHLGKMAQNKAQSQALKDFGQTLVDDHTQAYNRLSAIAQSDGYTVPKAINEQHQTEINNLDNLSGQQFDQQFKQKEVQDHQQALNWLHSEQQNLQNPDLKAYADDVAANVEKHLNTLQSLENNSQAGMNGSPANATEQAGQQGMANGPGMMNRGGMMHDQGMMTGQGMMHGQGAMNSADRMRNATNGDMYYGTVTKYEPGQLLELKMRNHLGRHVYDLSGDNIAANVSGNIKPGDQVSVSENVDQNGRRSIQVQAENGAADRTNPANQPNQ